nr:cation:proton antiporter [Actinomycetota bacterium]
MNLVSPDEHQLLVFWTQLLVLLAVARLLGALMRRVGQPAVIGELGAGLVLGPSLLGRLAPDALAWLVPSDELQSGMLAAVAWIGVLLLLVETGLETDLGLVRRLGRATALVSAGSIIAPLVAGLAVGIALPAAFRGPLGDPVVFVLFVGTALSISSLAVVGKVLAELGLMRRNFGQVTLAAGMANDVAGWIMLGVIAGLATAGGVSAGPVIVIVVGIAVIYVGGVTGGQRVVDLAFRELRRRQAGPTAYLTAVAVTALAFGVVTQFIGAEAVLGAFVAGIVVGRSRFFDPEIRQSLAMVTAGVFAPIFFATAGLRVDLGLLATATVAPWAALVVAVAAGTKFAGAYLGSRLARLPRREGVLLGVGLCPRGTLEIVVATVGLALDVFNQISFTVIMVMAVVNSMAAPPLLRILARSWHGTHEEQE